MQFSLFFESEKRLKTGLIETELRKSGKPQNWKKWAEKVEFGGEKPASRIFRLMKIDVLRSIFNLEMSKK